MRGIAFAFLAWSAFDLPAWHLDRLGVALLGLAFAALAVGQRVPGVAAGGRLRPQGGASPIPETGLSPERLQAILAAANGGARSRADA